MPTIRQPAVAGTFYPAEPRELAGSVRALLQAASVPDHTPKALIVPHAGYIYSGPIAATAYNSLIKAHATIRRVVLLGPVHRVPVRGLATPDVDAFTTPLGTIPIDREAIASLHGMRHVVTSAAAHAWEHSLEVQLPFLQTVLGEFSLVPLAVGDATPGEVAAVLETLWGGPETLILISSDLSHFLSYRNAQAIDRDTVDGILGFDHSLSHEQACGCMPINGLLVAAQHHHLRPQLLDLCNSGDTAGDKSRVVGYAAIAFYENDAREHSAH
jgi:AmmeMemoRadiSam system protein B